MCEYSLMIQLPLALAVSALAAAPTDADFEKVRSASEPVESLSAFLTKYVGECGETGGASCKAAAAEFRKQMGAKKLRFSAPDASSVMQVGERGDGEGDFILQLTPFFAAGGYALTAGAPKRTDRDGNPVLPLMRIHAHAPDGDVDRLARMLRMQQLDMEVVFVPEGTWSLPGKDGKKNQGVKARLVALRVTLARSGETVAVWTGR